MVLAIQIHGQFVFYLNYLKGSIVFTCTCDCMPRGIVRFFEPSSRQAISRRLPLMPQHVGILLVRGSVCVLLDAKRWYAWG